MRRIYRAFRKIKESIEVEIRIQFLSDAVQQIEEKTDRQDCS